MKKNIKRIGEVITQEGFITLLYLIREKLNQKKSERSKYLKWMKEQEKDSNKGVRETGLTDEPFFSVFVIGEDERTVLSLREQSYPSFEIIILEREGKDFAAGYCQSLSEAVARCRGEYIGIVHGGDLLRRDCLLCIAERLNDKGRGKEVIIYSDEDELDQENQRCNPFFKPDYSPDTLRSFFYIGGFFCVSKIGVEKLGFPLEWTQDWWEYAFVLRLCQDLKAEQIGHVPKVLYHRRKQKKGNLDELAMIKEELFRRENISVHTRKQEDCQSVRVVYEIEGESLISIIIPSKDNPSVLAMCLKSISKYTRYENYEIIVVDNGSKTEHKQQYEQLLCAMKKPYQYHHEAMEFNFSKMCNIGRELARGELLLFLNDDIEVRKANDDWLHILAGQCMQEHTGAVGVKLYYPNSTLIQHVGVINYKSGAAHTLSRQDDNIIWDFGRNRMEYNYLAVTGACMMIKGSVFDEAGGFEESLPITFNDIEFCMRVYKKGHYNVVRNDVVLYHHESLTRGDDALQEAKFKRHLKEREKLYALHTEFVYTDPFYSQNRTQTRLNNGLDYRQADRKGVPVPMPSNLARTGKESGMIWNMETVQIEEEIRVEGYAYLKEERYNNLNQVYLVLEDEDKNRWLTRGNKCYHPTLAKQVDTKKKVSFAAFIVLVKRNKLVGSYRLGIYIKNPLSGRYGIVMSEKIVKERTKNG